MNLEIKIFEGNEVVKLLKNKTFIFKWKELASKQQKVTVQQEFPFVSTWFKQYEKRFQPILVLGFNNNSELIGLIPLAQDLDNQNLTHAGAWQAEYCGWLCSRVVDQYFIIQALIAIKRHFRLKIWKWGWLAPKSNINWLSSQNLKKQGIYITIEKQDSPILDVTDEDKIKKLNNKTTRLKINRYKRKGDFYIERITSKSNLNKIFDILEVQCNFRQMAMFGISPFSDDLNKRNFYSEKLNFPEDNHYTVLWSNNTPLAFNFGECDSDTVYIGVMSYNPLEGKNSPGSLLLIKLIDLIKKEGYHFLDLTPGGDNYKELFSNLHRTLNRPTIYFNKKDKVIADIKINIKNKLKKGLLLIGIHPELITYKSVNIVRILKKSTRNSPLNIVRKLISLLYKKETYLYYKYSTNNISSSYAIGEDNIKINNYSDLLLYNDSNQNLKIRELLSNSLRRFSLDDKLYTIVINGELAHYGWMTTKLKKQNISDMDSHFNFPQNSVVFYDFFTDPKFSNENFFSLSINKMINECKQKEIENLFIGTFSNNLSFKKIIEKIGFRQYQKLEQTKLLWKEKNVLAK